MKRLRLVLLMVFAAGFSTAALAQHPDSVNSLVDQLLLEIEGAPPRWEMTETEQQLRQIFSEAEFEEFMRSIRGLRIWYDDRSSEMLRGYITRLQAGTGNQHIRDLVTSLVQLRQTISPANTAAQPYTPPPPVMAAAPEGVTVTGRIRSRIEGSWSQAFAVGLVFALSADSEHILGFSYTTDTAFRDGYFQIDGLPKHGNIVLVAFAPTVKRLHWMDSFSLDHLAGSNAIHQRIDIGTVYATLTVPSAGSPQDLARVGNVVFQGKMVTLQLLALAGWFAERRFLPDYSQVDELTNRLYYYYTAGIQNYIQSRQPLGQFIYRPQTPPVKLNVPYDMQGPRPNLLPFYFMKFDDDKLLIQHGDGNVIAPIPYGFGIKQLERAEDSEEHVYYAQWATAKGIMFARYQFGIDENQQYYVDYTCDACDEPYRYYEPRQSRNNPVEEMPVCTTERAAGMAADYFSPGCSIDPTGYDPFTTLNLNRSGRLAYIFQSCAGPQTRGNVTYVIIERRAECKVIGSYTTTDPNTEFTIEKEELESHGGRLYERAVIYPMHIKDSNRITRLEFDVDGQQYRQAGTRPASPDQPESAAGISHTASPIQQGMSCPGLVSDIDGNEYPVIRIGSDCWMAKNLNTSRYRNGDGIPNVQDGVLWSRLESGAWVYYNNEQNNQHVLGKLYNGYAARDSRGVCPAGWHMPSDSQWNAVIQAHRTDSPLQPAAEEFLQSLREQPGGARFYTGPGNQRSFSPLSLSQTNSEFTDIRRMGFWLGNLNRRGRIVSTFNVPSNGNSILADANHLAGGYSIRCVTPAR